MAARWQALTVCLLALFMALLDVSIVNVALPSIQAGLDARPADLQWVVSGYALTFGVVLGAAGRFGDARGRRVVFTVGIACFTVTSATAGLAPTALLLIAARLVQGLAAGVVVPQISGVIQELFQGAERGRAFGLLGATTGVSIAIGPTLGGVLIHLGGATHGWRWIFFVNVPIGCAVTVLAWRLLPRSRPARTHQLDPWGVALLGAGVFLVLLPLIEQQYWSATATWLLLLAGAGVLAGFWAWELRYRRTGEPVLDPSLFRNQPFALGTLLGLLYFAGFTAIFFVFSLYLQRGLGYSPLVTGLAITPFALGSAAAAAVGGRVVTRAGRPLVAIGLALVILGVAGSAAAVQLVPESARAFSAAAPLLVAGVGSGLVVSPNLTLTLSRVPVARAGSAGGVVQTAQRIGSAAGVAAIGSAFFAQTAGGDWTGAYSHALVVTLAFVAAALLVAIVDIRVTRGRSRPEAAAQSPAW